MCIDYKANIIRHSTFSRWCQRLRSGDTFFGVEHRFGRKSSVDDEELRYKCYRVIDSAGAYNFI